VHGEPAQAVAVRTDDVVPEVYGERGLEAPAGGVELEEL
jgi:hypothetical protein